MCGIREVMAMVRGGGGVLRVVAAGFLAALLAGSLASCGSSPPARQVASLPGHAAAGSGAGPSTLNVSQSDQAFVDFARCLRAHGVNEPDPAARPGQGGLRAQIPPATPTNQAALAACNHFIAKVEAAKSAGASRELAQWLPSLVRYAACMRAHDIDMLDPGPQGQLNLGNVPGITSDFGRYSPQFRSADAACRHLLPGGIRDNGTGP
jgi:hypothetical protein